MKRFAFVALALTTLSACTSAPRQPDYACPLDENVSGACASVSDAYKASRTMQKGNAGKVQSVFDPRVQGQAKPGEAPPVFGSQLSNYPEPGVEGTPVFQQPRVMRVWVAPYVDADGNLRSGEYVYFSTPGVWNFGTLKKPGAASGIFAPNKPNNTGGLPANTQFGTQSNTRAPATRPPAPAEPSRPSEPSQPSAPAAQLAPVNDGGITQPYQRLNAN